MRKAIGSDISSRLTTGEVRELIRIHNNEPDPITIIVQAFLKRQGITNNFPDASSGKSW